MECQECHERPATLHFTKVINGDKTEIHVCEQCAKEKGYVSYEEEAYSLHDLLSGLFNFESSSLNEQKQSSFTPEKTLKCSKCGMTYEEFTHVGKFGCASCYHTFSDRLNPIFRRVHSGNTTHDGKIPKRKGTDIHQRKQLLDLKKELQQLIKNEEFEKAAHTRDEIKALERHLNHDQGEGEW
ncbi:UvrB/UvrC motif-containing protein [Aquibacillus koreensis]|uniref:UvrB/UvrC motif-containing protein n=1 Tax=Aquibacillus koreensis TaxID=279446 RepID=A0A9X3WS96_9BACI|nr:UvrB/UvrC motif-containing protein [Aquibacillus koreensis]MCT2536633.1 UvrB/UvrC motif-containing protein [Aquibacillus koreensis]MDC3422419.1 UvrB/UvrC motif-containing protein [Aquibacillus koreensis]